MRTIKLIIEYEGTRYSGWQVQPNGLAVQEVVEEALEKILGEKIRIHSSGRTDAGVHARGMTTHFKTDSELPLKAFREGVNSHLPQDIAVLSAEDMPEEFHARYSAKGKWYRYTVYCGDVRSPLNAFRSWHVRARLDLDKMKRAAEALVGEHDFKAFRTSACAAKTTVREIYQFDVSASADFIFFDVCGSGFLKNMVRMLVGTLVEVGLGKRSVQDVEKLLSEENDAPCGVSAPPHGLCLEEVWY